MTDRWIGVLLDQLDALKPRGDTVVVLVADHGIFLGERGWTGKISIALHPELIHVPLVVVDPGGRRAGERPPTAPRRTTSAAPLLTMTGVEPPLRMQGIDLSRLFRGEQPPAATTPTAATATSHYLRSDRWTFFADNRMREPRSTTAARDPGELHDIARAPPRAWCASCTRSWWSTPRAGCPFTRGSETRRVTSARHAAEVAGDLRGEARPAPGAARAGHPHQPAGGGEAARQGQADRPRADREAARPGLLRGARHLRPPPHPRLRHARQPPLGRRRGHRPRHDRRPPGVRLLAGLHRLRRLARRGDGREDVQGDGPGRARSAARSSASTTPAARASRRAWSRSAPTATCSCATCSARA